MPEEGTVAHRAMVKLDEFIPPQAYSKYGEEREPSGTLGRGRKTQ